MKRFLPLMVFALLAMVLAVSLNNDPSKVPSPLVGLAAPAFALPELADKLNTVSPSVMKNRVWMLNVWASWCAGCRAEHGALMYLQEKGASIVGLNYKDEAAEAKMWLAEYGDPYIFSAQDKTGVAGLEWGVYGVPETFIIDKRGVVRHKHIGPLDALGLAEITPLLEELEAEE